MKNSVKNVKYIIAALALSVISFTGCSSNDVPNTTTPNTTTPNTTTGEELSNNVRNAVDGYKTPNYGTRNYYDRYGTTGDYYNTGVNGNYYGGTYGTKYGTNDSWFNMPFTSANTTTDKGANDLATTGNAYK